MGPIGLYGLYKVENQYTTLEAKLSPIWPWDPPGPYLDIYIYISVVWDCSVSILKLFDHCYLQAVRQHPNIVGTPPNCSKLYWDYRASIEMFEPQF